MSRVPWHLFQDRQQTAHLIVAVIGLADGPPGDAELTAAQSVLTRFVNMHKPTKAYAATVVRDAGSVGTGTDAKAGQGTARRAKNRRQA